MSEALQQVNGWAPVPDLDAADRGEPHADALGQLCLCEPEAGAVALDLLGDLLPVDRHWLIITKEVIELGGERMKCPHCLVAIHEGFTNSRVTSDRDGTWEVAHQICPACARAIILLLVGTPGTVDRGRGHEYGGLSYVERTILAHPRGSGRPPCPKDVPKHIAEDYREACAIFADSEKAAAALGRRCLQAVLREAAGVKPGNLADEINEVLAKGHLPTHLSESIDAIRNIGNFATHPMKSQQSAQILDVEPGEAEWTLETLELLFDYYYTQPALRAAKRDALNAKLKAAGKPPMK